MKKRRSGGRAERVMLSWAGAQLIGGCQSVVLVEVSTSDSCPASVSRSRTMPSLVRTVGPLTECSRLPVVSDCSVGTVLRLATSAGGGVRHQLPRRGTNKSLGLVLSNSARLPSPAVPRVAPPEDSP